MIVPPRAISLTFSTRLAGDYYADKREHFDYADKWVRAASGEAKTAVTSGRYGVDFEKYTAPGMFEEAVNLCATAANTPELGFSDKSVANYTGSLEGTDGNSKSGTYGELTYAYADRTCEEFKNCVSTGGEVTVGSRVSTAAKKKSKPSKISNPRALATCQLEPTRPYRVPWYSSLGA